MILWTSLSLIISIIILSLNLLLLVTISTSRRLRTTSNILSCNLWLANCIVGIIGIFHNIFMNVNNINPTLFSQSINVPLRSPRQIKTYYFVTTSLNNNRSSFTSSTYLRKSPFIDFSVNMPSLIKTSSPFPVWRKFDEKPIFSNHLKNDNSFPLNLLMPTRNNEIVFQEYNNVCDYMIAFGPQIMVALFNSTISLLALLAMALVQVFSRRQKSLSRSGILLISICIWAVVIIITIINFILVQLTQSFALIIAFYLTLVSIFLMCNLVAHPLNLFRPQNHHLSTAITQSLWLLLHCLSFTLLAMMLVWEGVQQYRKLNGRNTQNCKENARLIIIQLTAYSLHCMGNPIIAILRNPRISRTIAKLFNKKNSSPANYNNLYVTDNTNCNVQTIQNTSQWSFLPENWWIVRPPPPPYRSSSYDRHRSFCDDEEIICTRSNVQHNEHSAGNIQRLSNDRTNADCCQSLLPAQNQIQAI